MRLIAPVMIGAVCFAAGMLAGLSIPQGKGALDLGRTVKSFPESKPTPSRQQNAARTYDVTGPSRAVSSAADDTRSELLQSIPPADDFQAREEWIQKLTPNQIPNLLEALCADLGPSGLEHEDRSLIDEAIQNWWKTDSTGLLTWLRDMQNGGPKRYLVGSLLGGLTENNLAQAEALAKSFKEEDPAWNDSEVQDDFLTMRVEKAWKKPDVTAQEMLALYARFSRGHGSTGSPISLYPPNFDFRKFLDGIAALSEKDGKSLSQLPSDTLEVWAKVDPQAAVEWLLASKSDDNHWRGVNFADWEDIAKGIAATSGPQAYHQWAADIVTDPQQGKLRDLILENSSDTDLVGIIEHIGNTAQRDEALATAIGNSGYRRSEDDVEKLALISTSERRLRVIAENPGHFEAWIKRGQSDPSFWPRVGLTKEQVNVLLSNKINR